jgi:RimJ/RimL family protein N-acetyltransferase
MTEIIFKPLVQTDLTRICDWFAKPHVLAWWDDHLSPAEIKDKYQQRIDSEIVCPYIVFIENKPVAFIQYYWACRVGDNEWIEADEHTVGIDQFIGEEDFLDRGYGTEMIMAFIQLLFQNPLIEKIITDVDPDNVRAKRCYEKSGFEERGVVNTPDGKSILMMIRRTKN